MRRIFITGTAGFIGFHLAERLLSEGFTVAGYDGMTDDYDVTLKQRRHAMLRQNSAFSATEAMLEDGEGLDAAVKHLLMASTSSVYGANEDMPFVEGQQADTQLSIYAATKKANESMGHAWAHVHHLPITMLRFFTVYGPMQTGDVPGTWADATLLQNLTGYRPQTDIREGVA